MGKLRLEVLPEVGKRKGQPVGMVVDADYEAILTAVQNKLQLKKKDVVTLCLDDIRGRRALPPGDLSAILYDGVKVHVCQGVVAQASQDDPAAQLKLTKKQRKAVDELHLVKAARGALAARGKPNVEMLAVLQHCVGVTGVVTLLRHDESGGEARRIGEACARLGMRWLHAPLPGPKAMGMIGADKVVVTAEDLDSLSKVRQIRELLQSGEHNLVVHCAAGLHRTGIFLYLVLRELACSPDEALEKLRQMRQETYDEFIRLGFQVKADALFAIIGSSGTSSGTIIGSAVEIVSERTASEEVEEQAKAEDEDDDLDGASAEEG